MRRIRASSLRRTAALALLALAPWSVALGAEGPQVALVLNVYNGDRAGPETDTDAVAMADGGLDRIVADAGGRVIAVQRPDLEGPDLKAYGRWNRYGLVSGHFADQVAANRRAGLLNIGLYNNCSGSLGMLGGLRHSSADGTSLRVGMVWIDAHGDYNTPETTLSGMLGGMPVAIASGDGLQRLRQQAHIDDPLRDDELLMVAVRDTDPLEQARIDDNGIARLSTDDLRARSPRIAAAIADLASRVDLIYVHIDLDVLDPSEIPGHPLKVPNGPTGAELGDALAIMFREPKTAALGLASYPEHDDPGGVTMHAIHEMVAGALRGIDARTAAADVAEGR